MEAYQNPALSPEERAADLVSRMTLREKVGQLTQKLYGFTCFTRDGEEIRLSEEFEKEVQRYSGLGTLYGLYRADPWSGKTYETGLDGELAPKTRNRIQKYVMEHSRFGIPVLMSTECPHGHQALDGYLLPVNLASGCTFAPELLEQASRVTGGQLRQMGVDLALVSALDVLRDPRWGRSEECFSEDPCLTARMGAAVVRGMASQGMDVTAKHLCAQGETTGGVNASAARIGQRELRDIHLPPVKACVEAGAASFMAAYNEIDGVFCHGNHWLLTDLLRGEYGFRGVVMSDGCAVNNLDQVTGDRAASGALAVSAGVDMGLWDTGFEKLEEAVDRGLVEEAVIDEAARRILTLKFRRGLFEHPYVPETDAWKDCCRDHTAQLTLAEQSMVLLKNENHLLPLDPEKPLRVALVGPNADAMYSQLGDYTPPVRPEMGTTPRTGLERFLKERNSPVELVYRKGCESFASSPELIREAEKAAADCDVIVAVLGTTSSRFAMASKFDANGAVKQQNTVTMNCGEGVDDADIALSGDQLALLEAMKNTGKPVITVLITGRPLEMKQIDQNSDGLFCCFYPGPEGGYALAELLFGAKAPAGRLSASLPDSAAQLPVYYNAKDSYQAQKYYNSRGPVRYGFGFGLTYTDFRYELEQAPEGENRRVTVRITNTGTAAACAVPQLYTHRLQGIVTDRVRLSDFRKIYLEAGQSRSVTLEIPEEALTQWDFAYRPVCPHGRISWCIKDCAATWFQGEIMV